MMHELPDAREMHLTDRRIEEMKAFSLWVSVAAIGVTVGLAGNAWCQTTTQTDSTVSTTPAEPSVSSKTVTTKTEVNPPVVVMRPSTSSSETTTTQSDTPYEPAPSVQENSRSKTTYGPDGVTHSESSDKTTTD
jgi:hypothetical protein